MRKCIFIFLIFIGAITAQAQSNSAKVVVNKDGSLVGMYVRETKTTYIANPLDWEEEVSKKEARVEIWTLRKEKVSCIEKMVYMEISM